MTTPRARPATRHRQHGVYAIEFALVFLVSFGLLYAIICYGLLFTFRFALQNAAEDGARAALRYQPDLNDRAAEAERVARLRTQGWLPATLSAVIDPRVQRADPGGVCGNIWETRCSMVVTVTVDGFHAVLPPFPGFALPDRLMGQASVLLEGGAL